jgi:MEMO1 family protein
MKSSPKKNPWLSSMAVLIILSGHAGCRAESPAVSGVRPPAAAGSFYPGDREVLSALVTEDLAAPGAPLPPDSRLVALLVPHAGYEYSGKIAGAGLNLLKAADPETVFVVGTGHRAAQTGALAWVGRAFRTPLGEYPVDEAAVRALAADSPDVKVAPVSWAQEHSVEVQVPFLQQAVPRARLVPLIMAASDPAQVERLGQALARAARGQRSVLVASSDLSHYPAGADAERVDQAMLKSILTLDPAEVARADADWMRRGVPQLACTLCGLQALETVMAAARALGADQARVLAYAHSGKVSGDNTRTVGYAAVAFYQTRPAKAQSGSSASAGWSLPQRRALLALAREALAQAVGETAAGPAAADPAWMQAKRAVFVTLKQNRVLRGCIGLTEARLPLGEAVRQMTRAAAREDPRFPPLGAAELSRTAIEISILSPMRRIHDPKEIHLGEHGVVVCASGHLGLFLPQVAQETGWGQEQFLNELCSQKAELPANAWRDPRTELYVFSVQAFSQEAP